MAQVSMRAVWATGVLLLACLSMQGASGCGTAASPGSRADGGGVRAGVDGGGDGLADGGGEGDVDGGATGIDGGARDDGGAHYDGGARDDGGTHYDGGAHYDGGPSTDGGAAVDGGASADGSPSREACTSRFGNALTTSFGRLDGYLVSIVPSGQRGCNDDPDHVHLQLKVSGEVYDVAVTTRSNQTGETVMMHELDHALLGQPWTEGWHTSERLDYPSELGLAARDFTSMSPSEVVSTVTSRLADVNHISVFATGYGPTGAHLVHRNGHGQDGALVLHPTFGTPHYLVFHFSSQSF